jgi:nicotinamidase/pyrazinamidase
MKVLIIVDVQNDFLPGGSLAVKDADKVIPVINQLQERFELIVATQDWHPLNHSSFKANGGIWPQHCVQGTKGAEFAPGLRIEKINKVFQKGTDVSIDSYSGFFDNDHRKSTGLERFLRDKAVSEVYVAGLATDYCVKFTALDAASLGFKTTVILSACRGVEVNLDDIDAVIKQMRNQGIAVIDLLS